MKQKRNIIAMTFKKSWIVLLAGVLLSVKGSTIETTLTPTNQISAVGTMGASLMYNGNNWVEDGCKIFGTVAINKAESGVGSHNYYAKKMWQNTYCTPEEFEDMDILAIQFASSGDIFKSSKGLKDTLAEYETAFSDGFVDENNIPKIDAAQGTDYVLKKWQQLCFEQKDNPLSKWYGTKHGKPFRVILCTHWHDGRTKYNDSVKKLAQKWGASICDLASNIGFSKEQPMQDGTQPSVHFAVDIKKGDIYGWHPLRGTAGKYIQNKMANIFAEALKTHFNAISGSQNEN